ncbi:MAG: serine/threonine-protein kinase [Gemmatimonas sp.]|uniref:serine/threonine-protein kinase n=1 Tax=Gemmatimonas sp. TaxID=1962908 RepID=UPI00391F442D
MSLPESSAPDDLATFRAALRGQYAIQRELGRGGMGIVLLGRDERLDRSVAIKVLPPHLAADGDTRERFLREARMAAQLSHPNIVPVYRADEVGDFAFFAMGYVDGETLGDRIRDRGTLPPSETVRILREVAWALAYAHARGIVHRDVKPENILLERASGRAVVTDFGIARADFNPALTQDGLVLGTVHYMSPEQASGEAIDRRSDLYALGCIGFLALSGRLPFEGNTPQSVLVAHATKEPPPLRSVAPGASPALAAVIDRCLRKRPADRYDSGEALAEALGKALQAMEIEGRDAPGTAVLSSDEAAAVWRRAAELPAEAAARLEQRMRTGTEARALMPGATVASGDSAEPAAGTEVATVPTDAYRLRDVEAAAIEAGISQRYVALALDELRAQPGAVAVAPGLSDFKERFATRLLGTAQRTLSVTRRFALPPRAALQALGRTWQSYPWALTLRDTLGGHPLDGGVMVFDLPGMTTSTEYKWTWTRFGVYVPQLRVSLAAAAGDSRACEVTITIDLRAGLGVNLWGYGLTAGGGAGLAGLFGAVAGKAALGMAGLALLAPAAAAAIVGGVALAALSGPLYRWEIGKAEAELNAALDAINAGLRALDVFGDLPNTKPPLTTRGDDFFMMSM